MERQSQERELGLRNVNTSQSKVGNHMMTYFDMDAQGYRTAKGSWTVRY